METAPIRGSKIVSKLDAITDAKRYYGYFALLSNELNLYKKTDASKKII